MKEYNEKCDIWSTGVLLFVLLSGTLPFFSKNNEDTIKQITKGEFKFSG